MLESIIFARNHYLTPENGLSKFCRRWIVEKNSFSFSLQFCPMVLRSISRRFIRNVFITKTSDFGRMSTDSKWIQWWKIFSSMVTSCWFRPKIWLAIRFASKFETKKSNRNVNFFFFSFRIWTFTRVRTTTSFLRIRLPSECWKRVRSQVLFVRSMWISRRIWSKK